VIGGRLAVGASYGSRGELGGATGYNGTGYAYSYWDVKRMVWAGVFWKPIPAVRLGGGPGWYQVRDESSKTISRVGGVVEGGVEAPVEGRFVMNLAVRVHVIPTTNVPLAGTTLALRPNWTHGSFLLGLGIRL
jgi:hypothetical protein